MYTDWLHTGQMYNATLRLIAGESVDDVHDACPRCTTCIEMVSKDPHVITVAKLNRIRAAALLANSATQLEKVFKEFDAFCHEEFPYSNFVEKKVVFAKWERGRGIIASECQKRISWRYSKVRCWFPAGFDFRLLSALILGPTHTGSEREHDETKALQKIMPGGYLNTMYLGLLKEHQYDNALFDALYETLPDDAQPATMIGRGWYAHASEASAVYYRKAGDNTVRILVDGENVSHVDVEMFVERQLRVRPNADVHLFIYTPQVIRAEWEFCATRLKYPATVIPCKSVITGKSTVDLSLVIKATELYHANPETNFVIMSSDSDYSTLIDCIPANKLCIVGRESRMSTRWKNIMHEHGIRVRYLDESLRWLNTRVFETEYLINRATSLSHADVESFNIWTDFIESLGRRTHMQPVIRARSILLKQEVTACE